MCEQNNNIKQQFNQEFCVNVRNLIIERLNKKRNCKELENLLQLGNFEYRVNIEDDKRKRKYLFIRKDDVEKFIEYYNVPRIEKLKMINLNKYGVEYIFQSETFKEKSRNTILEKYGCENISQNEEIKEKKRISTRKTTGFDYSFQNLELMRKSWLEKYGVDNISKDEYFLEKRVESYKNRSEEEWKNQFDKRNKTLKEKYGNDVYNVIAKKASETNKKNHNGIMSFNTEKARQTYFEKTGYNHPSQNPSTRKIIEQIII